MKNIFTCLAFFFFGFTMFRASAQTTLVLRPGAATGEDAIVASCISCGYATRNFGQQTALSAIAWTFSGDISDTRSYFRFDLSAMPANAILQQARLSLYANPAKNHASLSGPNNTILQRVTAPWNENTITWNTQPATTAFNQVALPATSSPQQDFTNINVTALVQDMRVPGQNFGFMLRLATETYYRSVEFASSDHADPNLRPKLEITYLLPTGITKQTGQTYRLSPNPVQNLATLQFPNPEQKPLTLEIFNLIGKKVQEEKEIRTSETIIQTHKLPKGIYYFRLAYLNEVKATGKFVVN